MLAYQGLHIRRGLTRPEPDEVMANLNSHSEIHLVEMLGDAFYDNDMSRNDGAEVEQYQSGPYFLNNVLDLF